MSPVQTLAQFKGGIKKKKCFGSCVRLERGRKGELPGMESLSPTKLVIRDAPMVSDSHYHISSIAHCLEEEEEEGKYEQRGGGKEKSQLSFGRPPTLSLSSSSCL